MTFKLAFSCSYNQPLILYNYKSIYKLRNLYQLCNLKTNQNYKFLLDGGKVWYSLFDRKKYTNYNQSF